MGSAWGPYAHAATQSDKLAVFKHELFIPASCARLLTTRRYDRELVKKTVRAMERVQQIKESREKRFWDKRMEGNEEVAKERDLAEVRQGLDLIAHPLTQKAAIEVTQKATTRAKAKA